MSKKFYTALLITLYTVCSYAQAFNMGNLGVVSTCTGVFYDNGGASNDYTNSQNTTATFCSGTSGDQLSFSFTSFDLESNWDFLYVYDGSTINSPLIGVFTGNSNPGTITSNNITGCLTFVFISDSTTTGSGWAANISCIAVPPPPPTNTTCAAAIPFCTGTSVSFSAGTGGTGNNTLPSPYNCLYTSPNPAWFYFQIDNSGNLDLNLQGWDNNTPRDVDFIVWGPFSSVGAMCGGYTLNNVVDCSYSASNIENVTIPNAQNGQFYLFLVTNYSNQPSVITFNQTGGTATTNCAVSCNFNNILTNPSACDPLTNTFILNGQVLVTSPPISGSLIVSSACGGLRMSDTIHGPFTDTIPFTIPGLTPNGGNCAISATFTSNASCSFTTNYSSPVPCLCNVIASSNSPVCVGKNVVLKTTGLAGATYSWTGPNGYSASGQIVTLNAAVIPQSGPYIIHATNGTCTVNDTVMVNVVDSFSTNITTPDDTICLHSSTPLTVTPSDANQGPFTYAWTPVSQGIISPINATTDVRPDRTTMYHVTTTSNSGCVIRDSFQVVIQGIGPKVSLLTSADYVCPGTPVQISANVSALDCGPTSDPLNPCLPNSVFALQDLGSGTTSAGYATTPYTGFYMDGRVQYLYRASELQALGLTAGTITDIGFNVFTKGSSAPYNSFSIKMGCTSLDNLPSNSYVTTGLSTVLNPQSYTTATGWNTHTLDIPYNWDGFSNLIIEVCYDNSAYTGYDNVYYTATNFTNSVLWADQDLPTSSGCTAITTPIAGQNRPNTRFIMCKAPLNNYNFTWIGSNGTTLPDTADVTVPVNADVIYHLTVNDGTCTGDTFATLHVDSAVLISAGPDAVICNGDSLQLNVHLLHAAIPYCIPTYAVSSIPYAAITPTGTTSAGPAGDDIVSSAIAMPFPFHFFCSVVNQYYISTNGFIAFNTLPGSGCCAGQLLPDPTDPNNLVTMIWEDLNTNSGGNIDYFVSGTAPNRVLVVRFNNVAYFGGGGYVNGEIHLYETTNVIEIHANVANLTGQTNTLGIENSDGTVGYSPAGYNATGFTISAPIAFRFTPQTAGNSLTSVVWSPNAGLNSDTILNPRVFIDTTTTYYITAAFTNGCVTHDTIKVSVGNFPYSVSVSPDTICLGDSVQLMFSGNGVSFAWSPNSSLSSETAQNPFASPTITTTYKITASDSTGCIAKDSLIVSVRTHPPISLGNNQSICPYDSVLLTPTGTPYVSYLWSTGATTTTISTGSQVLTTQNYSVKVNDGQCYYYSDTVSITKIILNPIGVQPAGDNAVCLGDSITLNAVAGFVSYQWSNGAQTQSVTTNIPGTYSYLAIDTNGCILKSSDTANVISTQPPVANILTNGTVICIGQSNPVLYVNNPVAGIDYMWNPGAINSDSLEVTIAGNYILTANDRGCKSYSSIDITSANPPEVSLGEDQNICSCDTAVILTSPVVGNYHWSTTETTQSISVHQTGNYALSVSDVNNCSATASTTITIRCLTADAIVLDPQSGVVFNGQDATLNVTTDSTGSFNYVWTPGTYLSDSTLAQPTVTAPQSTTTYVVFVRDIEFQCTAYDSVTITVVPNAKIPMPNAFSPNGDGRNDLFGPIIPPSLTGIYKIGQFRIYNRWGQMVHNSIEYWDGTFNGATQPAGTYLYYITIVGPDQNDPSKTVSVPSNGSFTLLH